MRIRQEKIDRVVTKVLQNIFNLFEKSMKTLSPCVLILLIFALQPCYAKIGDCPEIVDNHITYQSHADYVEAVNAQGNILWHTQVIKGIDFGLYIPFSESDAQSNISCVEKVEANSLIVTDKRNHQFILNKNTGEVISESKQQPFPNDNKERLIYLLKYYGGLIELAILLIILGLLFVFGKLMVCIIIKINLYVNKK